MIDMCHFACFLGGGFGRLDLVSGGSKKSWIRVYHLDFSTLFNTDEQLGLCPF